MIEKKEVPRRVIPPYLPYKTLGTFLDRMKRVLPSRIDRSVMPSMSGMMQSQLIATLEYLNLINPDGTPTEKLAGYVHSEGSEKQRLLKEIITSSYSFLFKEGFDLGRATLDQLHERFEKIASIKGDTTRKCLAFFIKAAEEAGIDMYPHIKKPRGPRPGTAKSKRKSGLAQIKKIVSPGSGRIESPPGEEVSLEKLLLSKFPSFDPDWSDEVKAKWFEGFSKLMDEFKK